MIEFLKQVESKYDVNSIKVNGIPVWGVLRTSFYVAYGNRYLNLVWSSQKKTKPNYLQIIRTIFTSLLYVFRRYNYFFLSESNERKRVNNWQFDKLCDGIIDIFGQKECLLSELPVNGTIFNRKEVYTKNIITSSLFYYLAKLMPNSNYEINGEGILDKILVKNQLDLNYRKVIIDFLKYRRLAFFFLKKWKPKAIFIKCYYSPLNQGFISAAKSLGIRTIELQHGLISEGHPSYKIFTYLDKSVFPEWILTNGDLEKSILNNTEYTIYSKIIPVGNYYLEKVKSDAQIPQDLKALKKVFKYTIAITMQKTVEDSIIEIIKEAAIIDDNILFIIIPRNYTAKYDIFDEYENIRIFKDLNFYDIIPFVDFHSTVYSTCAIEAIYFDIPNILIDVQGKAVDYFYDIFKHSDKIIYVHNSSEFIEAIKRSNKISKIKETHNYFYSNNYKENIKNIINILNIN